MKITIEIDHKTTHEDVQKLIEALKSVYTAPKPKEEKSIPISSELFPGALRIPDSHKEEIREEERSIDVGPVKKYDTVPNVYESLDIPRSITWIYYLVREKKIPYRRNGKKSILVNKEDILKFYSESR